MNSTLTEILQELFTAHQALDATRKEREALGASLKAAQATIAERDATITALEARLFPQDHPACPKTTGA